MTILMLSSLSPLDWSNGEVVPWATQSVAWLSFNILLPTILPIPLLPVSIADGCSCSATIRPNTKVPDNVDGSVPMIAYLLIPRYRCFTREYKWRYRLETGSSRMAKDIYISLPAISSAVSIVPGGVSHSNIENSVSWTSRRPGIRFAS